jgi:hypothetical protein
MTHAAGTSETMLHNPPIQPQVYVGLVHVQTAVEPGAIAGLAGPVGFLESRAV